MIGRFWCLGTGPVIILGGVAAAVTAATFALTDDLAGSFPSKALFRDLQYPFKDKGQKQQEKPKS